MAVILALIGLVVAIIAYLDSRRTGRKTGERLEKIMRSQKELIDKQEVSLDKHDETIRMQDTTLRESAEMNLQLKASVLQMADLMNTQGLLLERTSQMHEILIGQGDAAEIQQEVSELRSEVEKKKRRITATLETIYEIKDSIGLSEKVTVMKYDKAGKLYEVK